MYYTSFTLEHWGKYMDYTWTVSTPTSSSGKLQMSVAAVRHRFLVAVFVVVFCPCWCWIRLRVSLPGKGSMFTLFQAVFLLLDLVVCLWTSKQKDGWMVVSSLTLHSGQSYPGTREQPGSRTGTRPGWETGWKSIKCIMDTYSIQSHFFTRIPAALLQHRLY